jgi:hypothetical protein
MNCRDTQKPNAATVYVPQEPVAMARENLRLTHRAGTMELKREYLSQAIKQLEEALEGAVTVSEDQVGE